MQITHNNRKYRAKWDLCGNNRWNGAFYYSKEIIKNIKPLVDTDRNWITVNIPGAGMDHSIVFIHNNKQPKNYEWLRSYKDLVLVCGIPETCEKLNHLGRTIYLPLSIDTEDVAKYAVEEKDKEKCFAGRRPKRLGLYLPGGIDFLEGMPRTKFLAELARYKEVYAVGRTAIEAKALGCKVKAYDPRFPDPSLWTVLDNRDAAKILQAKLDEIDKPGLIGMTVDQVIVDEPAEPKPRPRVIPRCIEDKLLDKMTKAQLAEYAETEGIKIDKRAKKAEIIKTIKDAR